MNIIEHSFHPFVNALAWAIIHSLWQFTLIMILVKLAIRLSGKINASIRYILNLIAFLAIPLSFATTFIRQFSIYTNARMIVSIDFEDVSWVPATGGSNFYLIEKSSPAFLSSLEAYTPLIFWLYIIGLLVFSIHGIHGYLRVHAIKRRNTLPIPEYWSKQLARISDKAEVIKRIQVYASEYVQVPVVLGVIKPVILLPLALFTALSPEQIEAILLHEYRHIRNKDHYINILQHFIEILFFFHPATWWIGKQLREEREKQVDEWVVDHTNAPLIYAQALFSLEKNRSGVLQPVLAATQSKKHLLVRIKNIMTMKTRKWNTGRNLAALMIIMSCAITLTLFDPGYGLTASARHENFNFNAASHTPFSDQELPARVSTVPTPDQLPEAPSTLAQAEKKPKTVVLEDGDRISLEAMSAHDREALQKAMEEMRLAIAEVNKEVIGELQSEEFKEQIRQIQKEMHRAMEEVHREVLEKFQSEEFQMEMRQADEEARNAIIEANLEMNEFFQSEEFKKEIKQAREEIRKAMEELEKVDWVGMGETLRITLEETGKLLEDVGPVVEDIIRELNINEIIKEVMDSVNKALEEAETQKEPADPIEGSPE